MKVAGELVYKFGSLRYEALNSALLGHLAHASADRALLDDKQVSIKRLKECLKTGIKRWWGIEWENWRFWPAMSVERHKLDSMFFSGEFQSQSAAIVFLEQFISAGCFVHGRLYDADYDYWQNMKQVDLFVAADKSTRGLTITKDPLGYKVVDVSRNPGRRIMQKEFIEAVGSVMWFDDAFWPILGKARPDIRQLGELDRVSETVDRITVYDKPFTLSSGEEGEIQKNALRVLFASW